MSRPADDVSVTAALAAELERLRHAVEEAEAVAKAAAQSAAGAKATGDTLAAQLAAVRTEVAGMAALGAQVGVLADRVTELAAGVAGGDGDEDGPRLASWFDADTDQAQLQLVDLGEWVYAVLSRYVRVRNILSDCWPRHPAAVDALNALRLVWCSAYRAPGGDPRVAADWHVRLLPGTVELLQCELGRCDEQQHAPGGHVEQYESSHPRQRLHPGRLVEYAAWWADTRGEAGVPEPGLPDRAPDTDYRPVTPVRYGGAAYVAARAVEVNGSR